jgi:ABC-type cobalt transport system substrate-binding protein
MKKTIMIALVALMSFGAYAQHDHAAHGGSKDQAQAQVTFKDEKLGTAYSHYIHLKDALVASKSDEAKKAAAELQKSLASLSNAKTVAESASKIAATSDLDDQRKEFSTLSNEMTTLVKASKLSMGSIYVEYCPMANNNEGAYWLSNEKQIKNPYFGDAMLKCGSVKETIQ